MANEAKWNLETGTGTYRDKILYDEVRKGIKIKDGGVPNGKQSLAEKKGIEGTQKILKIYIKRIKASR